MKTTGRRNFIKAVGGFAIGGIAIPKLGAPAVAQEQWPARPVRFIVPLAPGGAIDFVARQCARGTIAQLQPAVRCRKSHRRRRHASAWTRR